MIVEVEMNLGSLDDFEDAVEALKRTGVSFVVCVRVKDDREGNVCYRVKGELNGPRLVSEDGGTEWGAMKQAVGTYCDELEERGRAPSGGE